MILGIDATNWIHQLWHAQGGRDVAPLARQRLQSLIDLVKPSFVVACFDCKSFRRQLDAHYKEDRQQKVTGLVDALHAAPHELSKMATIGRVDDFEADDLLATLAWIGMARGEKVVLASPDKDIRQCLVYGEVTILRKFATNQGRVESPDWYTAARLTKDTGLTPGQWPDYQTLVGDKGDSIDGCPGWGEKTAAAVLQKVGSLDACFANPWSIPCTNRQRDSLLAFRERAAVVRQLVTLRTDVMEVHDCLR